MQDCQFLRNEIQKVFLCVHPNKCAHTGGEKNSALGVISMNFVHFIDPESFRIAFSGILS